MTSPALRNRRFQKICWVVPDVHAAIEAWARSTGLGPFFLFEKVTFDNAMYRARPAGDMAITAAFVQAGDIQIELVSQNDDRPSFFRDIVPAGKTGFHHMALYCKDYDADFKAYREAGATVAFSATVMGARNCWLDVPGLGFMIELLELNSAAIAVFDRIREITANWDGKVTIQSLT